MFPRSLFRNRASPRAEMYKKVERFQVSGLTFSQHGDKLSVDSGSATSGGWLPSSFSAVFQQKTCKPTKFQISSFAPRHRNTSKDNCVFVSCWTFLCRTGSRFLVGPTRHAWGGVRLFCSWMPPCSQIVSDAHAEVAMLLSVRPASHHICQPEYHPSGLPRHIRIRKPTVPLPPVPVGAVPRLTPPTS